MMVSKTEDVLVLSSQPFRFSLIFDLFAGHYVATRAPHQTNQIVRGPISSTRLHANLLSDVGELRREVPAGATQAENGVFDAHLVCVHDYPSRPEP